MSLESIRKASQLLSESRIFSKKKIEETEQNKVEISLKENEDEVFEIFSNILSVGLAQVEDLTGGSFENAQDAQDFLSAVFVGLKGKGKSKLTNALRKFDRVGGDVLKQKLKRTI